MSRPLLIGILFALKPVAGAAPLAPLARRRQFFRVRTGRTLATRRKRRTPTSPAHSPPLYSVCFMHRLTRNPGRAFVRLPVRLPTLCGTVALLAAGCGAPKGPQAGSLTIDDALQWQGQLELQVRPGVANTLPTVVIDPFGEFIVSDLRETQIRRYSQSGQLLAAFGREGQGPGEFMRLSAAFRQRSGDIWAFDMGGRIIEFDSNGVYKRDTLTGIAPIYDVTRINDSLVAIAGRNQDDDHDNLIHIWNNKAKQVQAKFFPVPPHNPALDAAYALTGGADVAARGDTLAATFARADTLYLYRSNGSPIGKITIPFIRFRAMETAPPPSATGPQMLAWRQTFSSVSQLFWAPDGSFYIQYFDLNEVEPQWRLLHMTRQGRLLFDLVDTPRLLAVAPDSRLFFLDPATDELNVWKIARPSSRG